MIYPASLRDLLMYLHVFNLYQPKWSDRIHEEWMEAVLRERPDVSRSRLERTRSFMDEYAEDAKTEGFDAIEVGITGLPDPDDRHVLAAAIAAGATYIVTYNLRDFPAVALAPHGVTAVHPDLF